jgi:hypothetical protein
LRASGRFPEVREVVSLPECSGEAALRRLAASQKSDQNQRHQNQNQCCGNKRCRIGTIHRLSALFILINMDKLAMLNKITARNTLTLQT